MTDYVPINHYDSQIIQQIHDDDQPGILTYLDESNDTRYDFFILEAIRVGNLNLVKFFIDHAVQQVRDKMYRLRINSNLALENAIRYNQKEIVQFLIYDKLIAVKSVHLLIACQYGRMQMFADLYSHISNHSWENYFMQVIQTDNNIMFSWLLQFAKGLGIVIRSEEYYLEVARQKNAVKIIASLTS
jgi:hypothetical protein